MGHNSQFVLLSNQKMVIALWHNLKIFRHVYVTTTLNFLIAIQLLMNLCLISLSNESQLFLLKYLFVWENEAPQDWRDAILMSLYKKRSKSDCGKFRGISLVSNVGGARGVMVIVTGNGHGDTSSNPGRGWLHFS